VDERAVMCGSHNWSNDGTLDNRDASLIFHDPEIAAYYQTIFLHDWDRLARPAPSTDEAVVAALRNTEEGRTPRVTNEAWTEMLVD
jgi:phosphatidylserine/phosphatidylglycerophosphate/cardiolipin synthase-like enzyme